jgi:oxygen-independent coproporphyrinogen-3 oxidase
VAACAPERLPVHTIFFGGGTPSLLSPAQFEQILQTVRDLFNLPGQSDLETCLEANPGTVTLDSLRGLRRAGFNRISFGVQSFQPGELRQLERIHDPFDVLNAVRWARQAGFDNLNLDLIYGLSEQPLARWQANVKQAVELTPQHLSLYALTIEHGTPYGRWAEHGLLPLPDPDLAADMYEWASEYLEGQGYEQYEISNWSKPGYQCRHNLQYWRNLPYLGFGAGAHGCVQDMRVSDVLHIKTYLDRFPPDARLPALVFPLSPASVSQTRLTPFIEMQETMMLGLRLTQEGVSVQDFHQRFGREMMEVFGKEINELVGLGLLEWVKTQNSEVSKTSEVIRLTRGGRLLGNQVFMRFVD